MPTPRSPASFGSGIWPGVMIWIGGLATGLIVGGLVILCSCASNPIAIAQTPEQKTYALYGSFVIYEELAAKISATVSTPVQVRVALMTADSKAKLTADALLQAFNDYEMADSELKTGTGTAEKLDIATTQLNSWIASATTDINSLIAAVKGAKNP